MSTWDERELPLLQAIARWEEGARPGSVLQTNQLLEDVDAAGGEHRVLQVALQRLSREGYIEGVDVIQEDYPIAIVRLRERGLRAANVWPASDGAGYFEALAQSLKSVADEVESTNPERAGFLRRLAHEVGGMVRSVGVDVASRVLTHMAGAG